MFSPSFAAPPAQISVKAADTVSDSEPLLVVHLHWSSTNAWLDAPESAKQDALVSEVLLCLICATGCTWKLGGRGGVPVEDGTLPDDHGLHT